MHSNKDMKSPPGRYSITKKRFRLVINNNTHKFQNISAEF